MVDVAKVLLKFIIVFLVVYIVSYIISYKKNEKFNRKKLPLGINYLILKYKLDIVKIGYKRIKKTLLFCDSFIIASLFIITSVVDNVFIRLVVSFILVFPLFAGVYYLVNLYYKKESE